MHEKPQWEIIMWPQTPTHIAYIGQNFCANEWKTVSFSNETHLSKTKIFSFRRHWCWLMTTTKMSNNKLIQFYQSTDFSIKSFRKYIKLENDKNNRRKPNVSNVSIVSAFICDSFRENQWNMFLLHVLMGCFRLNKSANGVFSIQSVKLNQ